MSAKVSSDEVILKAENLLKVYNLGQENEFEALHHINFEVRRGELICVMGPSGSGKSTFINNISTIDMPTGGKVYIDGTEVRTMLPNQIGRFRSRNLGFIFQEFNLLDTHTLFENIAMPLSLLKKKPAEIRERVEAMAEKMNISHILRKYPKECSGGQRQRAAICRALITDPRIIIADEPTGNLDSKNTGEFLEIISELNEQQQVTIIMVTHDAFVASYSSRLIYIQDGDIRAELVRGGLTRKEYFDRISELNARESREALA